MLGPLRQFHGVRSGRAGVGGYSPAAPHYYCRSEHQNKYQPTELSHVRTLLKCVAGRGAGDDQIPVLLDKHYLPLLSGRLDRGVQTWTGVQAQALVGLGFGQPPETELVPGVDRQELPTIGRLLDGDQLGLTIAVGVGQAGGEIGPAQAAAAPAGVEVAVRGPAVDEEAAGVVSVTDGTAVSQRPTSGIPSPSTSPTERSQKLYEDSGRGAGPAWAAGGL